MAPIGSATFERPVAVIGDIHGAARELRALLDRIGDLPIFVVGDLCDHGPDTRGVIDLLIARGATGVRGNHDDWFVRWASGHAFYAAVLEMGAAATLASYGVAGMHPRAILAQHDRVPRSHLAFVDGLHVAFDLTVRGSRYWLTHAGVPSFADHPRAPHADFVPWLAEHEPDALVSGWTSPSPLEMPVLDRPVVMGHVTVRDPIDAPHVIAINTGAGDVGGRLTAVILPERRFVTVRSHGAAGSDGATEFG